MKTKLTIRFCSGREEQFELDVATGASTGHRLMEFAKDPTLLLQTEGELLLIPAHSIEYITLTLPATEREQLSLPNVRKVKRIK